MSKIASFLKKNKKYFFIGLPILAILAFFTFGGGNGKAENYTVERADVEQSVMLSGTVMSSEQADLGFAAAGRLARILVSNNQKVGQGQMLAQLEIGDLAADLKIREAETRQDGTGVENAYRKLISEDLEATPGGSDYDAEAPIISGIYDGPEGQYKISISREAAYSNDLLIKTFGLEKSEVKADENGSTPIGTRGLYISFPDDFISSYFNTTWYVDIPNKASASYLENYNAWLEAKNNMERQGVAPSLAEAEIQKINAEIRKNTIYAPFRGVVTNIEKEVGENASVGERVISILGENKLEVVLQVSELDVSKLSPGSSIEISIDAFPDEKFAGTLKTVNSRETEIDGVPVYEAFVELAPDERIKTGMSANGEIILASKQNVVAVPIYLVKKVGEQNFVQVLGEDGKLVSREINLGLVGSDSMAEVIFGLEEGEIVLPQN